MKSRFSCQQGSNFNFLFQISNKRYKQNCFRMNNSHMEYKMTPMRDVYYEEEKKICCGKLTYKV